MANTTTSPNMSLPIPVVSTDPGPDYANNINQCLTTIDQHNHASGNGVQITPSGINVNATFPFNNNYVGSPKGVAFFVQSALISGSQTNTIYASGVDLYFNDGNGNQIRLTQSGAVAGTPGSISSLTSPASASYSSVSSTFIWQSAASTPANLDAASVVFRNLTANSKGLTLNPPNAMGSNYSLTLPGIPAQTNVMTLDTSGNMGSTTWDTVGSNMTSTGANAIGSTMTSTGANAVGSTRVRTTGTSATNGNIAISATATGTVSGASYSTVCSCTFTSNGGPIFLNVIADPAGSTAYFGATNDGTTRLTGANFKIQTSGGTAIAVTQILLEPNTSGSAATMVTQTPPSLFGVYTPGAGTYTFQLQAAGASSHDTATASNVALVAYQP